ncbi:MAG: Gfo/Idh/MocA family oxidoreductase, partial [Lentisphaeria bacterium]|nr:Gfo/Idh/MocA family oxidoreductase [Lentisphaeria bacterium]
SLKDPAALETVDAEDSVMIITEMANNAQGYIEATKIATGTEDEMKFEIHGSKGAIRFNAMQPHNLEIYNREEISSPIGGLRGWTKIDIGHRYPAPASSFPTPKASFGWVRSHVACLHNFLNDCVEGDPGTPGLGQGMHIQIVMDAVRRSIDDKKWVSLVN